MMSSLTYRALLNLHESVNPVCVWVGRGEPG